MLESRKKIEIQLRAASGAHQKKLASNIRPTIENEYAQRYLESIGVHATRDKVDYVLSNMPVEVLFYLLYASATNSNINICREPWLYRYGLDLR